MKSYFVLGIIAVLLVSGCVSQTGTPSTGSGAGYGLEITDFSVDQSEVFSGQSVHPTLTVENLGQDVVSKSASFALLIVPGDWNVISGPAGVMADKKVVKFTKNLDPENTVIGTQADSKIMTWTVKPEVDLEKGEQRTDTIFSKIYYDYETVSKGLVWIYPESERTEDNKITSTDTFTATRGPLDIDVSIIPDPTVVEFAGELLTVQILITNIGDGTPYSPGQISAEHYSISEDDRNNVTINIIPKGTGTVLEKVDNSCETDVLLVNNKATVMCDLNITSEVSVKQSYPLEIRVAYGYTTEEQTSVTVTGK
jgi:hypothetical protein